jgi:ferric-dicitrate binding protein FerR (iron transport regulator)
MAWRRRVLVFDNRPLSYVVAEINRYRPGRLVLTSDALGARMVRARFSLNQLADAATLIREAFGARVTELPGGIVLLS